MVQKLTIRDENKVWVPYVRSRISLDGNETAIEYVATSDRQGLGEPARCGKIENHGPGRLSYRFMDNNENWMQIRILNPGGWDGYLLEERVQIHTLELTADSVGTLYSVNLTAKAPERIELVTTDEEGRERIVTGFILGDE